MGGKKTSKAFDFSYASTYPLRTLEIMRQKLVSVFITQGQIALMSCQYLLASPLITKLQSGSVHMEVTADACLLVIARISDRRVP